MVKFNPVMTKTNSDGAYDHENSTKCLFDSAISHSQRISMWESLSRSTWTILFHLHHSEWQTSQTRFVNDIHLFDSANWRLEKFARSRHRSIRTQAHLSQVSRHCKRNADLIPRSIWTGKTCSNATKEENSVRLDKLAGRFLRLLFKNTHLALTLQHTLWHSSDVETAQYCYRSCVPFSATNQVSCPSLD